MIHDDPLLAIGFRPSVENPLDFLNLEVRFLENRSKVKTFWQSKAYQNMVQLVPPAGAKNKIRSDLQDFDVTFWYGTAFPSLHLQSTSC